MQYQVDHFNSLVSFLALPCVPPINSPSATQKSHAFSYQQGTLPQKFPKYLFRYSLICFHFPVQYCIYFEHSNIFDAGLPRKHLTQHFSLYLHALRSSMLFPVFYMRSSWYSFGLQSKESSHGLLARVTVGRLCSADEPDHRRRWLLSSGVFPQTLCEAHLQSSSGRASKTVSNRCIPSKHGILFILSPGCSLHFNIRGIHVRFLRPLCSVTWTL